MTDPVYTAMARIALFLLPYAPRWARPWIMGIVVGRKPERLEWRDGKWRLPVDSGTVNKALEDGDRDV